MKKIYYSGVILLGIGIGLFQVFLIPPFQNPDEIQHFLYSASYAFNQQEMTKHESQVLEILKESNWFHFVGIGPGWENIKSISDISFVFHFDPNKISSRKTLFHWIYGNILKLSGLKNTLPAFYLLRIISSFLFIIILLISFGFFKTHFPQVWYFYFFGMVLIFQFLTILNAVNYDVLMVLIGILFFITAYKYLSSQHKKYIVFMLITALLATFTKLAGIIFFLYLFILLCFNVKWELKLLKNFSILLAILVFVFCWFNYLFPERFFNLYSIIFNIFKKFGDSFTSTGIKTISTNWLNSMFDSFYFYTGWMGFKLNSIWYIVLKLFFMVSLMGSSFMLFSKKISPTKKEKKWFQYTLIICILQIGSILLYYGENTHVQGRYLYPIIIPIIILIYKGLYWFQIYFNIKKDYLIATYVLIQMVIIFFAITRVISVFYLEVASPHTGL